MEQNIRLNEVMTEEQKQHLWEKVDRRGDDECWPWKGFFGSKGQPLLYMRLGAVGQGGGTKWNAARVVYFLLRSPDIDIRAVKSVSPCKANVNCVNPDHVKPVLYPIPVIKPGEEKRIEAIKAGLEAWFREGQRIRENKIAWTRKGKDGQPQELQGISRH